MFFRISVAAELAPRVLTRRSNSIAIPRLPTYGWPWDSLNAQAPLSKIDIRCEIYQVHFRTIINYLADDLACF